LQQIFIKPNTYAVKMIISRKTILLCFGILGLLVGQSCTPKKATPLPNLLTASVLIDSSFTSQLLNERVLVCSKLTEKDLTRKDLKTWIAENQDSVSQKKEAILMGSYRQYPDAWFYAQVVNTDGLSRQLVVDENNRIRCDGIEVFTIKNGAVKKWGSINRLTPFSGYPIPFLTFAIPFNISPKDTLSLLIHTQRYYGKHEVNLGIWSYQTYLGENIYHFLNKLSQVILFTICILVMFILGRIFRFKTMTYLGYFLISLLLIHITSWGFIDALLTFKGIGLSAYNVSVVVVFGANVLVHPFLMEWMKAVPKNEKVFKGISYLLIAISTLAVCCFFTPENVFLTLNDTFFLPQLMTITALAGIIWLFYCSFLALIKSRIYYMLFGFTMAYLPFFLQQFNSILFKNSNFLVEVHHPSFILGVIGLSTISIFLLREQLVTRKKSEENLTKLGEMLEDIRKNEVETIGRNLHDNVGNMLASVLGYLNLKNQNPEVAKNLLHDSINEVRFLSHTLVKQDNQPIVEKLEILTSRFNDFSAITFLFSDFSRGKLNKIEILRQQNLYMIVQEILTNIVKHSNATEANIQTFDNDGQLQITIDDDGIGMDLTAQQEGIGLQNIHKRAKLSAFKITIDSNATGTNYIIEVHEN
jgi:signal transduction histidine kinase